MENTNEVQLLSINIHPKTFPATHENRSSKSFTTVKSDQNQRFFFFFQSPKDSFPIFVTTLHIQSRQFDLMAGILHDTMNILEDIQPPAV